MNNKKLGNTFEKELCEILFKAGFWVHNFANKTAGQPADIIACRDGKAWLIDAKECTNGTFDTRRVEENQKNSMILWADSGNGYGYFALKISENEIYLMSHVKILEARNERRILSSEYIRTHSIPLNTWLGWRF